MAAPVISISSDISDESVGSFFPRVILIVSISVEVSVAPEVGAATVALPVRVLELDTHSSSEADPSKTSLPPVSVTHMVSPFLWRSRVASRSSSPTTSTSEIPTAPIPPALSVVVAPSTDIISLGFDREEVDHSSSDHSSSAHSTSDHSSLNHSSSGHFISGHSVSRHTPPVTTIADSPAPSRFVYPPLVRTPRYR
ncbi:hypothetical protein Tco_1203344 [Tanacetum coccineum]